MALQQFYSGTRFLILTSLGLQLGALALVMGLGTWGIHHMSRTEDLEFYEGFAIIEAAYQLQDVAEQEIIATRGSLLAHDTLETGFDPNLFAEYEQTLTKVMAQGRGDDAALVAEIAEIGRTYRRYAERVAALIRAGKRDEAIALHVAEGVTLKRRWLPRLDELVANRRRLVDRMHEEVNRTEDVIKGGMVTGVLLLFPLMLLLAWIMARRVLTPLKSLEAASNAMGEGALDARVPALRADEFGRVAEAFNAMASRVEDAVLRLREANEELRRLDRHKDEFLSIVSHELRTPLNAMRGFASLMANGMAGEMSVLQRTYASNVVQSADRMERLVNDLLDLASLRLDKLPLDPAPTDYRMLVDDVMTTLAPLVAEKGQTLTLTMGGDAMPVVDYDAIARVLVNLVANAVKFTPTGGHLTIDVHTEKNELVTNVTDTGIGIAEADFGLLFQPFSQVDMGPARTAGGTGLGLSISKALIEAHGGTIGLVSGSGAGSTFWFRLPLKG